MNSFTHPKRGENGDAFQARRQEMVEFISRKHGCEPEIAAKFLETMDHVGIAYIGVEIRQEQNARRTSAEYSPFAF